MAAPLHGSSRQLIAGRHTFGAPGELISSGEEQAAVSTYRIKEDGSELQKVAPNALGPVGVSADGQWVPGPGPTPETRNGLMMYPLAGGSPTLICESCSPPQGIDNGPLPSPLSWTPVPTHQSIAFMKVTT
jgi:hypothetical protein